MRNKKGFTLIELLAIIVILAVIAVITVPIILNIIDNAEKGSAQDSALGYKDALQKYYATKSVQNPEQELPSGYMEISELPSDFTVSGENPIEGWVKLKNGIVEKYSLKYKDYVVSMDNDKNVISEKKENVDSHVTNDYQEIEYLESTGTQYINTGITGESIWNLVGQYMTSSDSSQILVGCGASAAQWFGQYHNKYALGTGSTNIFDFNSLEKKSMSLNFAVDKLSVTIDGITKERNGNLSGNYYYLFGGWSSSSGDFSSYARIYEANAYKNDEKVRQFVPVVRKNDNKPGMLDLANISKNLFSSEWEQGYIESSNGMNSNSDTSVRTKNYISVIPNKHYAINRNVTSSYMNIRGYDINKNYVGYGASVVDLIQGNTASNPMHSNNDSCVIAPKENVYYLKFNDTSNDLNTHYMMVEGDTQAEYEPYKDVFYTNAGTGEFISGPEL